MFAWLVSFVAAFAAQSVEWEFGDDTLELGSESIVRLTFRSDAVRGAVAPAGPPDIPAERGLTLSSAGSGHTMEISNGVGSRAWTYDFRIGAREEGTWVLGPASGTYKDGSPWRVPAIEVTVVGRKDGDRPDETVFEAELLSQDLWEGQTVLLESRLTTTHRGAAAEVSLRGLTGLRLASDVRPVSRVVPITEDGRTRSQFVDHIALVATGTGPVEVAETRSLVSMPTGRRSWFGTATRSSRTFHSPPVRATVRPLPPPPKDFSGIVADVSVATMMPRTRLAFGESTQWRIEITADGDALRPSMPAFESPGATTYPEPWRSRGRIRNGVVFHEGAGSWAIVPGNSGTLRLPPYTFSTFSPSKGVYETHTIAFPAIEVGPAPDDVASMTTFVAPADDGAVDETAVLRRTGGGAGVSRRGAAGMWLALSAPMLVIGASAVRGLWSAARSRPGALRPYDTPDDRGQMLERLQAARATDPEAEALLGRWERQMYGGEGDPSLAEQTHKWAKGVERDE